MATALSTLSLGRAFLFFQGTFSRMYSPTRAGAKRFPVSLAAALFLPAIALAQGIDLGGHIGFYIPLGAMVEDASVQKRLQTAPALGADVMAWPTKHLGFAGNVAWAPSKVAVTAGGQ